MGLSFVDRDMIMRYFGGGIGHLGNSPCQANSEQPDTEGVEEEMEINEDGIDSLNVSGPGEVEDIIMNFEVENSDDEQGLGPESELDSDEEDSADDSEDSEEDTNERASVDPEDSDDDGYGSF